MLRSQSGTHQCVVGHQMSCYLVLDSLLWHGFTSPTMHLAVPNKAAPPLPQGVGGWSDSIFRSNAEYKISHARTFVAKKLTLPPICWNSKFLDHFALKGFEKRNSHFGGKKLSPTWWELPEKCRSDHSTDVSENEGIPRKFRFYRSVGFVQKKSYPLVNVYSLRTWKWPSRQFVDLHLKYGSCP